jgi:hypothetical protein
VTPCGVDPWFEAKFATSSRSLNLQPFSDIAPDGSEAGDSLFAHPNFIPFLEYQIFELFMN